MHIIVYVLEPEIVTLIDSHPSHYNSTRNSHQEPSRTEPGFHQKTSLQVLEFKNFLFRRTSAPNRFEVVVPVSLRNKVETFLFVGARLGFQLAAELWIVNRFQVNSRLLSYCGRRLISHGNNS
uniref:Uncharacterized protein n=1 Tax=Solanum lycopersicum TaxID=4081 RepID=A0A3Q7HP34_SOLLC